jgi:predicted nucleic acid-binding protein
MAVYLLDSSVIIDALNNKHDRRGLLRQLLDQRHTLACCPINVTEIYAGMRPDEADATERFLRSLQLLPMTWAVAKLAGEISRDYRKKGKTLNLGDLIIAATALHNNLTLLTGNIKDFPMKELALYPLP